ncbi:MAG: acetate kinase [Gemmataceae bacterium]|nr:acetate kinase [Gemmataceae bacterium]
MKVLVCNAGSSTLKLSLFEAEEERLLADGLIDWTAKPARLGLRRPGQAELRAELTVGQHADAISRILDELQTIAPIHAVGHRVVHGGDRYSAAARITPEVKRAIDELAELAPLHNPPSLGCITAFENALPGVPQVAAFDTAFHATLSAAARTYPVPRSWTRDLGIRRYGFHGLSHSYCAGRAAAMIGRTNVRLIIAHLGNGASVSAVREGVCVDTSMGFTPLEGLMMGTRSGSVDPGVLIYMLREKGLDGDRLDRALNHESGLLGVSGVSSDMRQVLAAAPDNPDARLAVDIYVHRIRQTIGAMAATLGGVDGLVFTAGVGENSAEIRERVCANLDFLGLALDRSANRERRPDADIAAPASKARILVIATREDLTIVRETRKLIGL